MSRAGQLPVRTCIGCGERDAQSKMLRICADGAGHLRVVGRRPPAGRSAYLHPRGECWQRFASRKGPVRSLGRNVGRDVRAALVGALKVSESSGIMG